MRRRLIKLETSPAALISHHFQEILATPNSDIFHHAPVLVIAADRTVPCAVKDCSLAAENLMLAAHVAGLGTCWIGFSQAWRGLDPQRARTC
jgi:nitroreductase